jgi:nitrite reductase/ring-hydroxylating ferredoxin subunit
MSTVKISEVADAPEEGKGRQINLRHPYTEIDYILGLYQVEGKYYCITDLCKSCEGSLSKGVLQGMFAFCNKEECAWNIRKGFCKWNRSDTTPIYKVAKQEDGLYIEI